MIMVMMHVYLVPLFQAFNLMIIVVHRVVLQVFNNNKMVPVIICVFRIFQHHHHVIVYHHRCIIIVKIPYFLEYGRFTAVFYSPIIFFYFLGIFFIFCNNPRNLSSCFCNKFCFSKNDFKGFF